MGSIASILKHDQWKVAFKLCKNKQVKKNKHGGHHPALGGVLEEALATEP